MPQHKIFTPSGECITGNQLLEWLEYQSPAVLQQPVGFVGHYGEFFPMGSLPSVDSARRDRANNFGSVKIIRLENVDIGPEPD